MVLAIEEAHSLHFIHRDIKPGSFTLFLTFTLPRLTTMLDNFVIDAGGHLKLCDFGLAYSGHWSHDAAYFREHRESVLRKLSVRGRHELEMVQAERTYSNKQFEDRVSERREKRKRARMAKSFVGTNQ
jgi:serine/threonine protein kinase